MLTRLKVFPGLSRKLFPRNHAFDFEDQTRAKVPTFKLLFQPPGGVSLILKEVGTTTSSAKKGSNGGGSMHQDLKNTFLRDWESQYAYDVDKAVDIVGPVPNYE